MASLRWVLLRHECPDDYREGSHWDLMLERAGVADERRLATWSLQELPAVWGPKKGAIAEVVGAVALVDHRAAYLEYEGPVGGGRGEVRRVASGTLVWLEYATERVVAELLGGSLAGVVTLTRQEGERWRLAVAGC